MKRTGLFLLLLGSGLLWPPELAMGDPERGFRGFLAIRGERVEHSENASRLFVPGSVLKLVVASAALHHLGPDYRIDTELAASGTVVNGRLSGGLVLRGSGDPTWNDRFDEETAGRRALRQLARQVWDRGVRVIEGDLIVDRSRFPGRSYPASRPISEAAFAYAAPTSAIAIDENKIWVDIAPGTAVGAPGRVVGEEPWHFVNRVRTAPASRHDKGTVEFLPQWGSRTVIARGEYPISEPPYRVPVSVPWPEMHAAKALRQALRDRGITIEGEIHLVDVSPLASAVARVESPPLVEMLQPILEDSHNWYAEMLLQQLAFEVAGQARLDEGLEIERRFLEEVVGIAPASFVLDDGSGLSPYNLLSPEAVAQLLAWVWRQPWRDAFLDALPSPGEGTLRAWGRLPPIRAKTGTVRHSLGLAGYLSASDPAGEPLIFVCFLNHRDDERPGLRAEIVAFLRQFSRLRQPEM